MEGTSASAAIHEIIDPWNRAVIDRDLDALLSMCTDDLIFMPPGEHPVSGDALGPWFDNLPKVKTMFWDIDDVQESGPLAAIRGSVKQTFEMDGEEVHFDGKYCDVVRRGDDGRWRFSLIIWNANEA